MSLPVRLRQDPDGTWRAISDEYEIEVTASSREKCLERLHEAVLGVLPAVSWERGPPVVWLEEVPRLVGVTEAADILGWDKRRVSTYVKRGAFPPPLESLAGGRIWAREDIQRFADRFRRKRRRVKGARRSD
jgi:hypothetical protein